MFDWRYWRWQLIRTFPLAAAVVLVVALCGWSALTAIPPKYTASARIVLERQIGLPSGSKAQRTTEDVQHLQLVIHALHKSISDSNAGSKNTVADQSFDLKIESSRDKPTYFVVKTKMPSELAAITLAASLSTRAMEISEDTQQALVDNALGKLRADVTKSQSLEAQARNALNTRLNNAPATLIDDLRAQASELRKQLRETQPDMAPDSPVLETLYADLATARSLYSDLHPKVRLIRVRIERALTQHPSDQSGDTLQLAMQKRLQDLETQLKVGEAFQTMSRRLQLDVASSVAATQLVEDALRSMELALTSNRMRLKVVKDAGLIGRSPAAIRMALLAAIMLASLLAALGAVAIRIRFDRHIRRPRDLHRALGLTPFATLPDFGPSLG